MSAYNMALRLIKQILLKASELNDWLRDSIDWNRIDEIIELARMSLSSSKDAFEEMKELCTKSLSTLPPDFSQNALWFLFKFGVGSISLVILWKVLNKIFSCVCMYHLFPLKESE